MNVKEMIERYSGPDTSEDVLREFAKELLEGVKFRSGMHSTENLRCRVIAEDLDKALEELK